MDYKVIVYPTICYREQVFRQRIAAVREIVQNKRTRMVRLAFCVFYSVMCYNAVLVCHCAYAVTLTVIAMVVFNGYMVGVPVNVYSH